MRTGIKLTTVEISLNNFCSLSCVGCPSLQNNSASKNEFQIEEFINKFKHIEIYEIVLCGNSGEPLEHSMIVEILLLLRKSFPHTKIQVSTNGEKLKKIFQSYQQKNDFKTILFQVAVDGPSQEIHEITRKSSDFNEVINSLNFLLENNWNFEVISTRHELNEVHALEIQNLIKSKFNRDVIFRDTTIFKGSIKSPINKSKQGDVSFLNDSSFKDFKYTPDFEKLYVNYNGDVYPCVSFVKIEKVKDIPNIYKKQTWIEFYKEYNKFKLSFCQHYQKSGDKRQCELNCGLYQRFEFDKIKDLD